MVTTRAQAQAPAPRRTTPNSITGSPSSKNLASPTTSPTASPASTPKRSSKPRQSLTTTMTAKSTPSKSTSSASSKMDSKQLLASKTTHYEFAGPLGALFVSTTVPLIAYYLFFGCSDQLGCSLLLPVERPQQIWQTFSEGVVNSLWDFTAWKIYFGWYAFTVIAWMILPGQWFKGTELRIGGRLEYKINAFATMLVALAATAVIIYLQGPQGFTFLYDHWPGLVSASLFNSFSQAVYCYVSSFAQGKLLALGGNSGNLVYDWFIGRELNPRIGLLDLKSFNEIRPGLILWALLDISCACHQYVQLGRGHITDSMMLVCGFQIWYVADAVYNETAIFSTMDITTDGFGFMLSVGDLTWVPFVYSLQARYLAFHPVHLGWLNTVAILAVNFTGYYVFRESNSEKNLFRNGQNPKNLKYMTTESGRKLITSGWWGRSRHPNYLGDWIMAWAWSLPCGFETPLPFFYVAYFAVLLIHRQLRDDEACQTKYGKDWEKYTKLVPYRIVPGIY